MILQLKRGFLDVAYFSEQVSMSIFLDQWQSEFEEHRKDGMLDFDDHRIELTRKGFLHADALLPVFFEEDHQGVRYT